MQAIDDLKKELEAADVQYQVDIYDGAKHGFSNPHADERARDNGIDLGYHSQAAKESWAKMIVFMNDTL